MIYPCYIVAGGGRTSSHWLEQIIRYVTDYDTYDIYNHPFPLVTDRKIFHTHNHMELVEYPEYLRQTAMLVHSVRKDYFFQAISLTVARHTDEWNQYSPKSISLIEPSVDAFLEVMENCKGWNDIFEQEVQPKFRNVVKIYHEELVSNVENLEDFVAERLGFKNTWPPKFYDNQNPRNYRKIIRNYKDLKIAADNWLSAH